MPDQDDSHAPPTQTQNKPPTTAPMVQPAPQQNEVRNGCNDDADTRQEGIKELKREFRWVEVVTIVTNVILALVGVFALKAYYGQLVAMKGQLEQMQQSGIQTNQLIGLYRQQVDNLGAQLGKLDQSIAATSRLADEARRSADTSQRIFVFSNRPYVGISRVGVINNPKEHVMGIQFGIKNFGAVPGTRFSSEGGLWIDGSKIPTEKIPDRPMTIFPGEEMNLAAEIGGDTYGKLMAGTSTMICRISIRYSGPSGTYTYCDKQQFAPDVGGFLDLGPCEE